MEGQIEMGADHHGFARTRGNVDRLKVSSATGAGCGRLEERTTANPFNSSGRKATANSGSGQRGAAVWHAGARPAALGPSLPLSSPTPLKRPRAHPGARSAAMQPAMQPHAPLPLPQQYFAVVPAQGGPPGGTQFVPYVQLQRAAPASSPSDDANADAGFDGPASYPPLPGRPVYVARPPVRYPAMAPAMPMLPPGYAGMPPPAVYPAPVPGGYLYAAPPQLRPAKMDGYRPPSYNMALPYLPAPPPPGPTDADDAPITNIYIRGLSATVTDEQLHDMCRGFGRIVSSKAIIDIRTNECKGYGFVMYETQDEARLAMGELARRGLQVSFAKESFSARLKNLQDSGSTNIYLSNIPIGLTEEGLIDLFAPMSIVSQKILRDSSGVSRGVGFIRFETRDDAVRAIEKFNGLTLPGGTAPLQVRFSDSPAQKKLKVAAAQRRRAMKHGPPVPAQGVFGRRQSAEGGYYPGGFYLPYPPLPVPVVPEYAWPVPMPYPPAFAEDGARLGVGGYEVRAPRSPSDLGASAEASAGSEDEGYEVVDGGEEELAAMVGGMRIGGEVAGAYAEDADADAFGAGVAEEEGPAQ